METLTSNLKAVKNALSGSQAWVWLVDLARDSSNISRYCSDRQGVIFNGVTYAAKALAVEEPSYDADGSLPEWSVMIGNADRVEIAYLELGKYRGQRVTARRVNLAHLSSPADQIILRGIIKSAGADEQWIVLHCGTYDLGRSVVPKSTIQALRCRWKFKSEECGYSAGETSCDLSYNICENTMNNLARFGGAPGIPKFRP